MPTAAHRDRSSPPPAGSRWSGLVIAALGGLLGGVVGGLAVVAVTLELKATMDFVSAQAAVGVVVVPVVGLALAVLLLHRLGRSASASGPAHPWRTFPSGAIRADITGDIVDSAGREERFPWRLAPLRAAAIFSTVGLGGAMGTEAPAAYLGVATGACLGDRGRR